VGAASDPYLQRLLERWPPPSKRNYTGTLLGFQSIERELGLSLPAAYKELIHTYGQGVWFETIFVLNPFLAELNDLEPWWSVRGYAGGSSWCNTLRTAREEFPRAFIHPIYPEPGGIFPWAFLQDGGVLYWLTAGPPPRWKTLFDRDMHFQDEWEVFEMPITELLWRLATGDGATAATELDKRIAPYRSVVFEAC
jgi:hypothetical protein